MFKKHFNSTTMNGRANVAKVTYASIALLFLYMKITKSRRRKAAALAAPPASPATNANGTCSKCHTGTVCKENGNGGNGATGCAAQENGHNDNSHEEATGTAAYAGTEEKRRKCVMRDNTQATQTATEHHH